jgi:hypothetical protein
MGDLPGHPFHGNQYTTGSGGQASGEKYRDMGHPFRGNQSPSERGYTAREAESKAWADEVAAAKAEGRMTRRPANVRETSRLDEDSRRQRAINIAESRHPHDAAKHKAETSTEHTGLEHLKKEHPIKEIYHAIASIADDVASSIENL